jgi:aspartate/methionine/tyrosine aminotransferase
MIFSYSKVGFITHIPIIFELIPFCTTTFHHTQDDPYYFMYFGASPRIASYFMLEAQTGDRSVGRVLRFDSFSKILSSGIRIGFVTGPTPLLDAIDRHVSSCTNQPIISILRPFSDDSTCIYTHRRQSRTYSRPPSLRP